MGRLADRLFTEKVQPPLWATGSSMEKLGVLASAFPQLLQTCPIVEISNVAAYMAEHKLRAGVEELPCVAPKWDTWWMEYKVPKVMRGPERVGLLFCHKTIEAGDLHDWAIERRGQPHQAPPETRWVLSAQAVIEDRETGKVTGPVAMWEVAANERGKPLAHRHGIPESAKDHADYSRFLMPGLWAIAFIHCRNIQTETITPPEKLTRRFKARHGRPMVRYQVIKLQPLSPTTRRSGGRTGAETGIEQALHIVPGGFHHYGDCCVPDPACTEPHGFSPCIRCGGHEEHGLLFGRTEGMFWVESHSRGNPQRGVVISDMEIKMPVKAG